MPSAVAVDTLLESTAAAGVVVTLAGSLLGMPLDSILVGFIGALVAQTLVPSIAPDGLTRLQVYLRSFAQLVAAGILAGLGTPLAEAVVHGLLPIKLPAGAVHLASAATLGMIAPAAIPMIRKIAEKWVNK